MSGYGLPTREKHDASPGPTASSGPPSRLLLRRPRPRGSSEDREGKGEGGGSLRLRGGHKDRRAQGAGPERRHRPSARGGGRGLRLRGGPHRRRRARAAARQAERGGGPRRVFRQEDDEDQGR